MSVTYFCACQYWWACLCMCCYVHLCVCAGGDGVMTCVCVCVYPCMLVCNPFILTVVVFSGDRKEAGENKRPNLDGPFYSTQPAPHIW